jgi:hypothetical protein
MLEFHAIAIITAVGAAVGAAMIAFILPYASSKWAQAAFHEVVVFEASGIAMRDMMPGGPATALRPAGVLGRKRPRRNSAMASFERWT